VPGADRLAAFQIYARQMIGVHEITWSPKNFKSTFNYYLVAMRQEKLTSLHHHLGRKIDVK